MVQKYHQNDSLLRGQLQGSVSVRSVEVLTYQWHHWGSVHLAIFDHLWMFEIVSGLNSVERIVSSEETDRGGGRISERREKGSMITLILSLPTLLLICETWQFRQNITLTNF